MVTINGSGFGRGNAILSQTIIMQEDETMKKKVITILATVSIMLCGSTAFAADSSNEARIKEIEAQIIELQAELETLRSSEDSGGNIEKESSNEDVEILAQYTLSDGIGWYTRHFMVIRNNTNETVDVSFSTLAYSSDGNIASAAETSFDALGAGCTSVLYEAFETDVDISDYETDMNVSPSKYYKSVIQDLSYKQNDIADGAVFQVTNNGQESARFVEGYALYFMGDDLVGFESTYFTDDDSEIKPGKTISKQMSSYKEFDRIEFYLTGRR